MASTGEVMKRMILIGALACFMVGLAPGRVDAGSEQAITMDRAAVEKMVQEEVSRQLPGAVSREIARQVQAAMSQRNVEARAASALSSLQTLRAQIELYKIQHEDKAPSLEAMADWSGLMNPTNGRGQIKANGVSGPFFGPYLQRPVVNPFNEKTTVAEFGKATATSGWSYNPKTGALYLVLTEEDSKVGEFLARDFENPK
jgi:general secretion pathway protein G